MDGLLIGEKLGPMPFTTVVNTLQAKIQPQIKTKSLILHTKYKEIEIPKRWLDISKIQVLAQGWEPCQAEPRKHN